MWVPLEKEVGGEERGKLEWMSSVPCPSLGDRSQIHFVEVPGEPGASPDSG